ncbi:MAG: hypothetical protein GTN38_03635 [Candidatus Aenigmarchaeota archaeon]|nr:hypothetical protein [Candidatus Aenigmarchaeota archaeon]NIP40753.1 hypothetical protein [Candidatus Aenigmarchaeota archaeon]NIQ18559.1 hypothetical protein [Candidatus Aenigmarchaeota archaeon]NIS73458.1 hypothetical protein [Candidatus Aenigmarchaeota archaeon]
MKKDIYKFFVISVVILLFIFTTAYSASATIHRVFTCRGPADKNCGDYEDSKDDCISNGCTWCDCDWDHQGTDTCGAWCGEGGIFCGNTLARRDCPSATRCSIWTCSWEGRNECDCAGIQASGPSWQGTASHTHGDGGCLMDETGCCGTDTCWAACGLVCRKPPNIGCTCSASTSCCGSCCGGVCITSQCWSGPCCTTGTLSGCYESTSEVCDTWNEYRCVGGDSNGCGATLERQTNNQYCSGNSAQCTGSTVYGLWATDQTCAFTETCSAGLPGCETDPVLCPEDTDPPITTITLSGTQGLSGWYVTNVDVTLTCSDGQGGSGCSATRYCVDTSNTCSPSTVYSSQFTISSEGTRYVRYYSTDNAGNQESTRSTRVRIDKTSPSVSVTGAPASWQNTDATASVSCSDSGGSGCDAGTYRLRTYASNPGSCPSDYASYTLSSPQTISSHVWVCAAARDNAGNTGVSNPVEFRIDKINPVADITGESTVWVTSDTVNLVCTDTGDSGCLSTRWYYFDSDGTCSSSKSSYYLSTTSNTLTITGVHNDWLCLWVEDSAGNYDTDVSSRLMVDDGTPTTPVVTDDGDYTSSLTTLHATWTQSTSSSGIAEYQYAIGTARYPNSGWNSEVGWTSRGLLREVTRSGLSLSNGETYYFNVRARSNSGLWSDVGSSDGITANVCYQQPCGTPCPGGICNGEDECYSGGGCFLDCSVPSTGPNAERRWVDSNCGRTGSYKCGPRHVCSNSYTSCTMGGIPRQVTGDWTSYVPPSGTYYAGQTINIRLNGVSNSPSGFTILSECRLVKPSGSSIYFNNWGTSVTFPYTIQDADPLGTWTVDYCGLWSDFESNTGWVLEFDGTDRTFTVDEIQVTVSVTGAPASWQNTDATANVTCVSNTGPCDPSTYMLLTYDSNPGSCPSDYASYTLPSPQTISSHRWVCAAARDNMGNEGFSSPVEFKVDKIPPIVSVDDVAPLWQNTDATASVSCSDPGGSGCNAGSYRLITYDSNPGSCPSDYASYTLPSPQTISSHVWVCGAAKDRAENEGFSSPVEFKVDKVSPTSRVRLLSTYMAQKSFNLSWNGTDDESGLDCYIIQYKYRPQSEPESPVMNINFSDGECTKQTSTIFDAEQAAGSNPDGYTFYFRSLARDNAGNQETKTGFDTYTTIFLTMVKFAVDEKFHMTIGRGGIIKILVRNSQLIADTIRLSLNMQEAMFAETGNRTLDLQMNPQEYREVIARIYPRSLGNFNLTVNANSLTDPQLADSDWLEIKIATPADFPGLNWPAIVFLLLLSVLIYVKLVKIKD